MAENQPSEERLAELRQRWERDPTSRVFLQLAEEYRRLGQIAEAIAVLEKGLEHDANSVSALGALGRCRLEVEEFDAAAVALEKVIQQDPTNMVAYRRLVDAHIGQHNATAAIERLEMYAQLNAQDPEIGALRARIARIPPASPPPPAPLPVADVDLGTSAVREPEAVPAAEAAVTPVASPVHEPPVAQVVEPQVVEPQVFEDSSQIPVPLAEQMPSEPTEPDEPLAQEIVAAPAADPAASLTPEIPLEVPADLPQIPPAPPVAEPPPEIEAAGAVDAVVEEAVVVGGDGALFALRGQSTRSPSLSALTPRPLRVAGRRAAQGTVPEVGSHAAAVATAPAHEVLEPEPIAEQVAEQLAEEVPAQDAELPALDIAAPIAEAAAPEVAAPLVPEVPASVDEGPGPFLETMPDIPDAALDGPTLPIDVSRIRGFEPAALEPQAAPQPTPEDEEGKEDEEDEEGQEPLAEFAYPPAEVRAEGVTTGVPPSSVETAVPEPPPVVSTGGMEAPTAEPAPADPDPQAGVAQPTATLGGLYLGQGHSEDARQIFEQVLAQDPENPAARQALDLAEQVGGPIHASQLLADYSESAEGGLSEKKAFVLEAYLARLSQGTKPDVS